MTTDDVKTVVKEWYSSHHAWPTKTVVANALIAKGFSVDDLELDEKIELLKRAQSLDPTYDPINIIESSGDVVSDDKL